MQQPPGNSNTPPSPRPPAEPPKESIKETIESILVAFILAFVFRAFVVEAFVIPSGSMAPTLLGAHMRFRCEECGYPFRVNYPSSDRGGDEINIPNLAPAVFSMHCPNCGFKVLRSGSDATGSAPIPVYYGDRILVLKYLYLLQDPARWDVVVFKSPSESGRYTQNFIKRLTGKPGETVMLLDGDVYVCPNEQAVSVDAEGRPAVADWPWQVQTKPRPAQEALWRVIFDQTYIPRNHLSREHKWTFPWQIASGTGWTIAGGGRILSFDNPAGAATLKFNKDANAGTFPFTDWLPYNETMKVGLSADGRLPSPDPYHRDAYAENDIPRWHVSDLKLQFAYRRRAGAGPLRASLTKLDDTFTAELLPDQVRLLHDRPGRPTALLGQAPITPTPILNVEFANVDYQVTLRINGKQLLQTTRQQYAPDIPRLLRLHREAEQLARRRADSDLVRNVFPPPQVQLSAENHAGYVSHLSLWRDIYYTPWAAYGRNGELHHASPENPVRLNRRGTLPNGRNVEDEYFVLGDNSILSSDARFWTEPVSLIEGENLYVASGRVPARFMLGKAFFVYWPAGFRPFSETAPGVIPNFGDMRFIH